MTDAETLILTYPLAEMLIGLAILSLVILVHGVGVRLVYRHFTRRWSADHAPWHRNAVLSVATASLAGLHLVVTLMWAWPIWWSGLIPGLRDAYYFVLENYTTLGDNTVSLPPAWRLIGPVIAISGLFNFGWTASIFVNMMHDVGTADRAEVRREHH
ncbi:two pore domain potassium channel family protein [Aestuariivirga litoralis]|uniref:Two pore domain potassium channel family protein n=1 Tax=Aestuariivirga litoralis TaxID=2650924 RepID=A0A2W2AU30_9HYPH|nr:ion channel [Aestuariivirga litoralis]PZF77202.1 two pore domain potassium channel family protein [Aestuariivirga litoralis]